MNGLDVWIISVQNIPLGTVATSVYAGASTSYFMFGILSLLTFSIFECSVIMMHHKGMKWICRKESTGPSCLDIFLDRYNADVGSTIKLLHVLLAHVEPSGKPL